MDASSSLERVRAAEQRAAAARRARERVAMLADEIAAEQLVCQALRARLDAERADVERLEDTSISSVLARLRGRHDELLDRERAEAAAVEVELATHGAAVRRLRAEFDAARELAHGLDDAQARLDDALAERARFLAADPSTAAQFTDIETRLGAEEDAFDRIDAALGAAHAADGAIELALESMRSVSGVSVVDTFLDGGALVSHLKHRQIDGSVERLAEVHAALLTLRPLLVGLADDVHQPTLRLPSTGLTTMDIWFDNMFSDLLVHQQIAGSIDELRRTKSHVGALLTQLTEFSAISRRRRHAVRAERDALLSQG